jgi:N-hydroxyarylamine O-acetyltransferase
VTSSTVSVRRPGAPTEHRSIDFDELPGLLHELNVPLTDDEEARLLRRISALRPTD